MDSGWQKTPDMNKQFLNDVKDGLTGKTKWLSSKYLYDEEGDRLFRKIMELEEYYLTDCEHEIFSDNKEELLEQFSGACDRFHLIEFGAGDAYKTKVLISHFLSEDADFEYNPIDISANAIHSLEKDLQETYPQLVLVPINMEYFSAVYEISRKDTCKKVILFLGSNIGNFTMKNARKFFSHLGSVLNTGDQALIGFDIQKDPEVILSAYNDGSGVTREFNLNLLKRINRELGGDFETSDFYHYPLYDPETGAAKSFLVSCIDQEVSIPSIPLMVRFREGETIFMEISQKYTPEDIHDFAEGAGFSVIGDYQDRRNFFVNSLWEKN
jgi:dimethylhistidine N-methyltransferase